MSLAICNNVKLKNHIATLITNLMFSFKNITIIMPQAYCQIKIKHTSFCVAKENVITAINPEHIEEASSTMLSKLILKQNY